MSQQRSLNDSKQADEAPGVPRFKTWRGVYGFVFGVFVVVVAALTLFSRTFA